MEQVSLCTGTLTCAMHSRPSQQLAKCAIVNTQCVHDKLHQEYKLMTTHVFLIKYSLDQDLLWTFPIYSLKNDGKYLLSSGVSFLNQCDNHLRFWWEIKWYNYDHRGEK